MPEEVQWDPTFDIYALAGGYYPLVGDVEALHYKEEYRSYGLGKSSINTPAYYISDVNEGMELKYANLKGNYVSWGALEETSVHTISSQYEDRLFEETEIRTDPEDVMLDAAETLDESYRQSLIDEGGNTRAGLLAEEGMRGRSMEEMFGAVEGMSGSGFVTDEPQIRAMYSTGSSSANPPDITAMGAGIDVSRQRLGDRGHTFYGTALEGLNADLRKVDQEAVSENLESKEIYKRKAAAGLKHFKNSYRRFNRQIRSIKKKYLYGGGNFSSSLLFHGQQRGKTTFMASVLGDLKKTNPQAEARRIAMTEAKGKATGFLTNQAINTIKHHLSFSTVDYETYVLDAVNSVHVEYGPIAQRPANVPREFEYFIDSMGSNLIMEAFAGDYYLKQLIPEFHAESAAERRMGAHVTKELTGQGTIMEAGMTYKINTGLMKNKLKLRPSVAVNQASRDFNDVIGKKLLPRLQVIAERMLLKQSKLFSTMLKSRGPQRLNDFSSWAIPYVSVMTFKKQAYG